MGLFGHFSLVYHFSFLSPSLWETARYRLKYCLKGPLSPKQPTNQLLRKYLLPPFAVYSRFLSTKMADTWESVKTVSKKLSVDQLCKSLFLFIFFFLGAWGGGGGSTIVSDLFFTKIRFFFFGGGGGEGGMEGDGVSDFFKILNIFLGGKGGAVE